MKYAMQMVIFLIFFRFLRYKEFADAVVLCAKLGNYTKDDELIVTRKAKAIVNCFVDSQIPPRIQVNFLNRFLIFIYVDDLIKFESMPFVML